MRVYVIAANAALGIKASNLINASGSNCIISQLYTNDYRQQLADLGSNIGSYDIAVVTTPQPVLFVIEANKRSGVRAAACRTSQDVREALEAGANTIAFNSSLLDRYAPELLGVIAGSPKQKSLVATAERTGSYAKRFFKQKDNLPYEPEPEQKQSAPPRESKDIRHQAEPDSDPIWDRKKGIKKNLKNLFGVD